MFIIPLTIAGTAASYLFLKYFSVPYILVSACWSLIFLLFALKSKNTTIKAVWVNLLTVSLLAGALEYYSYEAKDCKCEGGYTHGYFTSHEILGYGPKKNIKATSRKICNGKIVYDVIYTIDEHGRRITPSASGDAGDECIVFFGGSFTFGEGVNDNESMPYVVGELQNLQVINFGFHGYGPHQMLAAIQNGLIDRKPKLVVFQTLSAHVARSAGYTSWDRHGPRYVLRDGKLCYSGHFDDDVGWFGKKLMILASKSYTYNKFFANRYKNKITDNDISLYVSIVAESRNEILSRFPGCRFKVILWDMNGDDPVFQKILKGFNSKHIDYCLVSNILPGFSRDPVRYEISPVERHPSSLAHRMIAKYIVKNWING